LKLQIGIDGNTYELDVEVLEEDDAPRMQYSALYPMVPSTVHSVPAPAPAAAAVAEEVADESKVCRSPVTGVVIKVNVEPGQAIAENELLMVIEAMKMETNVTACAAGKVKSVRVTAGDSVKSGQVVIEYE
jgi:methylmalonyl-CoA carboxyltransferase small subunit